MADKSAIEWTDATWNPIKVSGHQWYCEKISPGCDNCYASMFNHRWGAPEYPRVSLLNERPDVALNERVLMEPHRWKQPRMVFVCSMTDIAGEWVQREWFHAMWTVMAETPRHTYQVLTKRPSRLKALIAWFQEDAPGFGPYPLPNVWIGSTIEADAYTWRANVLRQTPAAVRFISAEPLLAGLPSLNLTGIDWLISGGESGPRHRPLDLDWVRDLRDRCLSNGTAFFHKQHGGRTPKAGGRLLDGREWSEFPTPGATHAQEGMA